MSELRLSYPACTLADKTKFTPDDVQLIETRIFAKGLENGDAVATLLALEHCRAEKCAEWDDFFVRALSDHVINSMGPTATLTRAKADWLRRALSRGGLVTSRNEFEALVQIMEMAGPESHWLAEFALEQIRYAVMEGEGPLATRRKGLWATLGMDQLSFLNRILVAVGAPGSISIGDAGALFDPAHNLAPGGQETAWRDYLATVVGPSTLAA